ncbi:hypothetical protein NQ318_006216, partial [Aromia moschata]
RIVFCQQIIERYNENHDFLHNVFWTDESSFSTAGLFNRHSNNHWATENPHMVKKLKKQGRKTVRVWCGIHRNKIIGPFFLNTLTGEWFSPRRRRLNYRRVNHSTRALILTYYKNKLNIWITCQTIWQQYGAPPHNVRHVTNYLNQKYNLWIGKNGPIHWPAKSHDLNPVDFFLWGTLKQYF